MSKSKGNKSKKSEGQLFFERHGELHLRTDLPSDGIRAGYVITGRHSVLPRIRRLVLTTSHLRIMKYKKEELIKEYHLSRIAGAEKHRNKKCFEVKIRKKDKSSTEMKTRVFETPSTLSRDKWINAIRKNVGITFGRALKMLSTPSEKYSNDKYSFSVGGLSPPKDTRRKRSLSNPPTPTLDRRTRSSAPTGIKKKVIDSSTTSSSEYESEESSEESNGSSSFLAPPSSAPTRGRSRSFGKTDIEAKIPVLINFNTPEKIKKESVASESPLLPSYQQRLKLLSGTNESSKDNTTGSSKRALFKEGTGLDSTWSLTSSGSSASDFPFISSLPNPKVGTVILKEFGMVMGTETVSTSSSAGMSPADCNKLAETSRRKSEAKMKEKAIKMGANAVLSVSFDLSVFAIPDMVTGGAKCGITTTASGAACLIK